MPLSLETAVGEIRRDVADALCDLQSLTRIIRDGNGQDPLIVRVALLERAMSDAAASLREVREAINARMLEVDKGRWHLLAVIVAGVLSLLSAAASAFVWVGLRK